MRALARCWPLCRRLFCPLCCLPPALCGCIMLTADPRAIISGPLGSAQVLSLKCEATDALLREAGTRGGGDALDARPFRVLTWNIHKQGDTGWERDLADFASGSDVVLLQETALDPTLHRIVDDAGLRWVLASSFLYQETDIGVLTATRRAPVASCTQRVVEPILRIPKSAVITWLRIAGSRQTLAIVNVHAINFELMVYGYRAQIEALADAVAGHEGPIILAGDFNTWSDARERVLAETAARLGLVEIEPADDRRTRFLGRHVDHMFVRGLEVVSAQAIAVTSSDHNPMAATLRLR
ncbi:MAG: endonuclease/exonuclease/phosphatase family protein [Betaproteobacteria bacterium]